MSDQPATAGLRAVMPLHAAFGLNLLGNAVGTCGLPVVALAVTNNIAVAGVAVAASVIGATISGLLSGPIIDRVGARIAWLCSITTGSLLALLTCALWLTDSLTSAAFIGLCGLRALAEEPGRLATYGWMPELARRGGMRLERANAVVRMLNSVAQIAGPAVSGLILIGWHPIATVAVDAALGFLAAGIIVISGRAKAPAASLRDARSQPRQCQSYRRTFRSALSVLARDPLLISMTVAMTVFGALDTSLATVGLTSYSAEVLGEVNWYSALLFAFGIGGILGVAGFGVIGHRLPRRAAFLGGYVGVAALSGLLAWGVPFQVAFVLVVLVGMLTSPIDLIYLISLQERVPPALLNSVTGVATTIASAPSPLLIPIVATMLAEAGPKATFAVLGLIYLITLSICWILPAMRTPENAIPASRAGAGSTTATAPDPVQEKGSGTDGVPPVVRRPTPATDRKGESG